MILKRKIYQIKPRLRGHLPKNEATRQLLEDTACKAWQELDIDMFESLATTMPNRVKAVIEADG